MTDFITSRVRRLGGATGILQVLLVLAVLVAALLVNRLLVNQAQGPGQISAGATTPVVSIIRPESEAAQLTVTETATVQVRTIVSLAPQAGGRVARVSPNLASGGVFSAGEALLEIDPTDADLSVRQAQADLQTALSALELETAEAETARREWSLVNPDEPIPALVAREPQLAQAQASVASAQARLATAQTQRDRTVYSLPFDGRVLTSRVEVGQTLIANQPYGEAYAIDALEVSVPLAREALARLEPAVGRRAEIIDAPAGARYSGAVIRVQADLDDATRLAGLIVGFDSEPDLPPGAFVTVRLLGDRLDAALRLPADVIGAGDQVWTVRNGALALTPIAILGRDPDGILARPFDYGEGIVTTPPPGARQGLAVSLSQESGS
ncbi:MAG: efflux RND transporter periplasmic adaptor subunit [Pseudomonadota bacterium]